MQLLPYIRHRRNKYNYIWIIGGFVSYIGVIGNIGALAGLEDSLNADQVSGCKYLFRVSFILYFLASLSSTPAQSSARDGG